MKPERENTPIQTNHPDYGKVIKSTDGRIVCHICGKAYRKLGGHVVQKHGITSYQYKIMFGLETSHGLISDEHKQHLADCVMRNYERCVVQNLVKKGSKTRFAKGSAGRTKDVMSEQTRRKLVNQGKITKNLKYYKSNEKESVVQNTKTRF